MYGSGTAPLHNAVRTPSSPPPKDSYDGLAARYGPTHWKTRGYAFLHQHNVVLALVSLIFVDIVLLVLVLIIESMYPGCSVVALHCECEPTTKARNYECEANCKPTPHSIERLIETCNLASSSILILFLFEVSLHMACVGFRPFLVFDFTVLLVSLGIEMYVLYVSTVLETAQAVTIPLLLLSRSWRLFRIGHSAYEEATRVSRERIRELEHEVLMLKQQQSN